MDHALELMSLEQLSDVLSVFQIQLDEGEIGKGCAFNCGIVVNIRMRKRQLTQSAQLQTWIVVAVDIVETDNLRIALCQSVSKMETDKASCARYQDTDDRPPCVSVVAAVSVE